MNTKALQEDLQSIGSTPSLAKPDIEKKIGRQRLCRAKWVRVICRGGRDPQTGEEAAGDGATSSSVTAFQFGNIGDA